MKRNKRPTLQNDKMKTTDSICTTEINASQMLRLSVATHSVYSTLHDFAVVVVVIVLWRSVSPAIDDGGLSIEFDFPFNSHAINMLEKHRKFSSLIVFKTQMNQINNNNTNGTNENSKTSSKQIYIGYVLDIVNAYQCFLCLY